MCLLESQIVVFDLYGTLIKFGVQHHSFRQLLKWARENGWQVLPDDARTVKTIDGGVDAINETPLAVSMLLSSCAVVVMV